MTKQRKHKTFSNGHGTRQVILCLFALCLSLPLHAQGNKKQEEKPADWVILDHADNLSYDESLRPGVQIIKGNVKFRYQDNTLWCDSAFVNQTQKTFEAMGRVKMYRSSDRVTLTCDHADYNSITKLFRARKNVILTQPGKSLHSDSLDYNGNSNIANFYGHGRLVGDGSVITSERGDYNTKTKDAHFTGKEVVLKSPEYNVTTPSLTYNSETKRGHVEGPSVIRSSNGEIIHTDNADFDAITRSFTTHGHSTVSSPERDIEGDNMTYDRSTGYGEGHGNVKVVDKRGGREITGDNVKFRTGNVYKNGRQRNEVVEFEGEGRAKIVDHPGQRVISGDYLRYDAENKIGDGRGHVDYIDHKGKNAFMADYVHYTELDAIAYGQALAKEFSEGDTLFVHADTVKMKGYVREIQKGRSMVNDTVRTIYGIDNVRAFRTDIQAVCGLLIGTTRDSSLVMHKDPIAWNGNYQLIGDSIKMFMNDSTIREAHVIGHALSIEQMYDRKHYNQVSAKEMNGYFVDGKIRWGEARGNVLIVYYPIDDKDSSLIGLNYTETDTMRMYMTPERRLKKIWMPKSVGTLYPMNQIPGDKERLPSFAWFDYIRPLDKYDLFRHADKGDKKLPRMIRAQAPLQYLDEKNGKK